MTIYSPIRSPITSPVYNGIVGPTAVNPLSMLLVTLRASTYWAKLDAFYVMVGTDRLVNLKNPGTFNLTVTGAVYIEGVGYNLDGVDDFIATGLTPSTAGGNVAQNSMSFGYWSRQSTPVTTGTVMGAFNGTDGDTLTGRTSINNNGSYRANQATASATTGGVITDHFGLFACNRTNSTTTQFYYNGASVTDGTDKTSAALPAVEMKYGTANGSTFAACTIGGGFIGGSLTAQEHADLYAALALFWAANDAFNIEFAPDAYSWWAEPIAEVQNGRIVIGGSAAIGAGQSGAQSYMEIDETSRAVVTIKRIWDRYGLDDHLESVSLRLASGVRVGFLTGHGVKDDGVTPDNTLGIVKSTTGLVADFGAPSLITNTMTAVNYGMLHQMGNGRVVLTTNVDGTKMWGIVYSDNDGTSWTVAKPHVTMAAADGGGQIQMYEKAVKTGAAEQLHLQHSHTTNVQNNIRISRLNTTTGNFFSGAGAATDFGTVYAAFGAALTDFTNLTAITALAALKSQRLMDALDAPSAVAASRPNAPAAGSAFVVREFVSADGTGGEYYLYRLTGADPFTAAHWTKTFIVAAAGTSFWLSSNYYGGAVFAREPHSSVYRIYLSRNNGTTYWIDRYDSNDGSTWTVTNIKTSLTPTARPIATGSSVIPVIWQKITSYTSFNAWNMSLEWQ